MNKLELIAALREKTDLSKSEAACVVDHFFDRMADTLAGGDRVEIRGLCSFFVKEYKDYGCKQMQSKEKSLRVFEGIANTVRLALSPFLK